MTRKILALASFIILAIVSCNKIMPAEPNPDTVLAGPIEELTPAQLANHIRGDEEFGRVFGVLDGLGPVFVASSCESCHAGDGKGHPSTNLVRFVKLDSTGSADPSATHGGPQLQHRSIFGYDPEVIPTDITGKSILTAPAVTGLGYLEAVEDATLLKFADPNDSDGDGISGVPSYVVAPDYFIPRYHHKSFEGKYIGRFGKKGGAVDLLQQTANAYLNDIGITSDFNMQDLFNVQNGNFTGDNVPDPEVSASTVHNVAFYMRTLKVPPRRNAQDGEVLSGEQVFMKVGCNKCHVPNMTTGRSDIAALTNRTIHPYTDLLLHDMGNELDDKFTEGSATTSEWRTAPLWGISLAKDAQGGSMFLLHDGRARSIDEAIQYHGGEGSKSRTAYNSLGSDEKKQLLKFLESL